MISPVRATWPARVAAERGGGAARPRGGGPPRLGAREAPGVLEDALEEGIEVALARQSDPDLEQFLEQLRPVHRRRGQEAHGAATRLRPSRLASYSARSAAAIRSSAEGPSSGRQAAPGVPAPPLLVFTRMIANSSPP